MDNACILGYGVVGQATAAVFGVEKHYDVVPERSNMTIEEVAACDFVFVCLPTLVNEDGEYKVEEIKKMIGTVDMYSGSPIFIIRSTVYPGFAEELKGLILSPRIVSNPEFLNEATAEQDAKNPPFVLLGGESKYVEKVVGFYQARIKGAPFITTDNTSAEMAKLAMNAYFATKVIFANQLYDFCRSMGANYSTVKKVLESHPNGPVNHFKVWFRNRRGVHGRCLPKDSKAFAFYSGSPLLRKVVELNKDYEYLKEEDENL